MTGRTGKAQLVRNWPLNMLIGKQIGDLGLVPLCKTKFEIFLINIYIYYRNYNELDNENVENIPTALFQWGVNYLSMCDDELCYPSSETE